MPRLGVRAPLSPPACPCSSVRKERRRPKSRVGGSNPSRGTTQERSSVWPERRSPKPVVGGSNPPAPANSFTILPGSTCVQCPDVLHSRRSSLPRQMSVPLRFPPSRASGQAQGERTSRRRLTSTRVGMTKMGRWEERREQPLSLQGCPGLLHQHSWPFP